MSSRTFRFVGDGVKNITPELLPSSLVRDERDKEISDKEHKDAFVENDLLQIK